MATWRYECESQQQGLNFTRKSLVADNGTQNANTGLIRDKATTLTLKKDESNSMKSWSPGVRNLRPVDVPPSANFF